MVTAALVRKIKKEDRGGMYVKVSRDLAENLDLKCGEIIVLRGKKKTACWLRGVFDGKNEIIVSKDTWLSLGFNGYASTAVVLEKSGVKLISEITAKLVIPENKKIDYKSLKALKHLLTGTPVCSNGTTAVYLKSENTWIEVEVESVKPGSAGILHKDTLFKLV
ncbi:MAG: hypothetical protein DRJ52_10575 [Thermoprotei archaeon]|nr:MAG: hypothetical protein DRJ52_10575 [Thermoprotei archaeon]RLF00867.1 MAG: hypothetical protein DRJ63_01195 [Thermoprotei archaeon]